MTDHEFSSVDFEEGEVDDNSESDTEASPREFTEDRRRYGSSRMPRNASRPDVRKHSQHGKHHVKRKHERKSHAKSRHKTSLLTKSNGHNDYAEFPQKELTNHPRHAQRRSSLKGYVSGEELDFHVTEREKLGKRHSFEDRRRKKRRRNEKPSSHVAQAQCRYFMEGRCHKGDSCPFAHDFLPPKKQELCKFYAVGVCSKGPSCLYLHEEFPCKFFHISGKCNHGDSCKFSHSPLTPTTRALLDRVAHTKDSGPPANDRGPPGGGGGYQNYAEHGDVDYRFGSRPPAPYANHPLHPCENFERLPGPRNLFAPNFPPDDRLRPPCPNYEMRERMDAHPPMLRPPMSDGVPIPYCPDGQFPVRPTNPYGPAPYPPHRFPGPGNLSDGGFPPAGLHPPPMNNQGLLSPVDNHLVPQLPPTTANGPPVHENSDWHPEFAPFRPPFCPPPGPVSFSGPFPTGAAVHVNSEAIVSSELDKMAALLAASKPPTPRVLSVPTDPRAASSLAEPRPDGMTTRSDETQMISTQTPVLPAGEDTQRRASLSFSSPELNVVPPKPTCTTPTAPVPWRLIQLDMSVKIPYPLMQLPIDDLPHRFEDPRLRGQLTALRPHLKPSVHLDDIADLSDKTIENKSAPDPEPSEQSHGESTEKAEPTPRRPVKLQLNEMASTFSASNCVPVTFGSSSTATTRSGDRSYLDDPRFRRRRIVTCVSTTTASQATVSTSVPSESVDHDDGAEKNEPEAQT